MVGHLDDVLQLPRLLLHLGRQEQCRRSDGIPVEAGERVEHVEAMHVHDGGVDGQLVTVWSELRNTRVVEGLRASRVCALSPVKQINREQNRQSEV